MSRSSNNLALKQILETESQFDFSNQGSELAKFCISSISAPKQWASDLRISDRVVQSWISGENLIPKKRHLQIVRQAKLYMLGYHQLEDAIDRALMDQYGPNVDRGVY